MTEQEITYLIVSMVRNTLKLYRGLCEWCQLQ